MPNKHQEISLIITMVPIVKGMYREQTNHFCSSFSTHASFHVCTKSNSKITCTKRNNPEPNFDIVSGLSQKLSLTTIRFKFF